MTNRGSTIRLRVLPWLFALAVMGGPATGLAQERDNYGRTPDSVIPYRDFRDPYLRFFQTPVEFLGSGREKPIGDLPESVRIGFFGPLDGAPDAELGQAMLDGVTLAFEQANADQGYFGVPFELVIRADSGLWGASSNEMAAFKYEDDVLAVIGSIDGSNTHIALRVALKTQMPMINTGSTDPTLTETNIPWLLRCMADDRQQSYALAYHIFKEAGLKKVVGFRVNDRLGRMGIKEFRDAARRLRHPLLAELRWDRGERDFPMQLDRIESLSPEAVVIWGNAADSAVVVKALKERMPSIRIFGCDRLASQHFLELAGRDAEGVVAAATFDPTRADPRWKTFTEAFEARFQHAPETYAAHAYDGANILIEAVRAAGLNRILIRDAIYAYTHFDGVTGPIEFDTTLNDIGPVYLATVDEGRFTYREITYDTGSRAAVEKRVEPYRTIRQAAPEARSPELVMEDDSAIRIGCFLPLDERGQEIVHGALRALEDERTDHPEKRPVELVVRDTRGAWGDETAALVDLVTEEKVIAIIGSSERRGTHLAEMLAAKMHFPIVSLCATDASITQIPLPWVFRITSSAGSASPLEKPTGSDHELGYDAASLLIDLIDEGAQTRKALRDALAGMEWKKGLTGTFHFDALGNRVERIPTRQLEVQMEFQQ